MRFDGFLLHQVDISFEHQHVGFERCDLRHLGAVAHKAHQALAPLWNLCDRDGGCPQLIEIILGFLRPIVANFNVEFVLPDDAGAGQVAGAGDEFACWCSAGFAARP